MALALAVSAGASARAAEDACHAVLEARVRACTESCVARAKAAVDPEIRDRIHGYGCASNCMKLEMFAGNTCPKT